MKDEIEVETLAVYDNIPDPDCLEQVKNLIKSSDLQHVIMYFSPLGIKSVPVDEILKIKNDVIILSIGSTTTAAFPTYLHSLTHVDRCINISIN